MARTMTTALKGALDSRFGIGSAAKFLALINSGHTVLDGPTQNFVERIMGSVGEGKAFTDACAANTAAATVRGQTALMNKLVQNLGGAGNAEELVLCIADGTIT